MQLVDHVETEGAVVYEHACQTGLRGHCQQARRLTLCQWPLRRVAQMQEPRFPSRQARGRGGLGQETVTMLVPKLRILVLEPSGVKLCPAVRWLFGAPLMVKVTLIDS